MGATDLAEEFAHVHGVHLATEHPIQVTLKRADRTVDIHELPFIAVKHDRSPGQRRPTAPGARHAAEPGSSETSAVPIARTHRPDQRGSQRFGKFFFHACCVAGSLLGWRVSGATLRHPCRANSRHTTEAATARPNRCASAARIGDSTSSPASWPAGPRRQELCCGLGAQQRLALAPHRGRVALDRTDWRKRAAVVELWPDRRPGWPPFAPALPTPGPGAALLAPRAVVPPRWCGQRLAVLSPPVLCRFFVVSPCDHSDIISLILKALWKMSTAKNLLYCNFF